MRKQLCGRLWSVRNLEFLLSLLSKCWCSAHTVFSLSRKVSSVTVPGLKHSSSNMAKIPFLFWKQIMVIRLNTSILKLRFKHVCKLWEHLYDSLLLKTDKINHLYNVVIYLLQLTHWKSHALASVLQNKVYAIFASIFHEVYIEKILRITVTKTHSNKLSQIDVCNICKTTVRNRLTFSMRSHMMALLKYSMLVHSIPCRQK